MSYFFMIICNERVPETRAIFKKLLLKLLHVFDTVTVAALLKACFDFKRLTSGWTRSGAWLLKS